MATALTWLNRVQGLLTQDMAVVSEVGDSWFNSQKLRLPDGCGCAPPNPTRMSPSSAGRVPSAHT